MICTCFGHHYDCKRMVSAIVEIVRYNLNGSEQNKNGVTKSNHQFDLFICCNFLWKCSNGINKDVMAVKNVDAWKRIRHKMMICGIVAQHLVV